MVRIQIADGVLTIEVQGLHQVWALKSRLQFPLSSVGDVRLNPQLAGRPRGLRAPGTYIPRLITAGTFYADKKRWFWDVSDPNNALVIELENQKYQVLVVEVANPGQVAAQIEAARFSSEILKAKKM